MYNDVKILVIISKIPKLIVFSENFFGRKIVRQKQEFETLLKQHTNRFEDTIFAINYSDTEQTDISVADVDRPQSHNRPYQPSSCYNQDQVFLPNYNTSQYFVLLSITVKNR